jgi:hypothetical protein
MHCAGTVSSLAPCDWPLNHGGAFTNGKCFIVEVSSGQVNVYKFFSIKCALRATKSAYYYHSGHQGSIHLSNRLGSGGESKEPHIFNIHTQYALFAMLESSGYTSQLLFRISLAAKSLILTQ